MAGRTKGVQSATTSRDMGVAMKLINRSSFSDELIRAVIRFTRPPGIKKFKVTVTDYKRATYRGHGSAAGVLVRINPKTKYPKRLWTYQYGQLKGRRYYLASV